jgi:hypothetical protein
MLKANDNDNDNDVEVCIVPAVIVMKMSTEHAQALCEI